MREKSHVRDEHDESFHNCDRILFVWCAFFCLSLSLSLYLFFYMIHFVDVSMSQQTIIWPLVEFLFNWNKLLFSFDYNEDCQNR